MITKTQQHLHLETRNWAHTSQQQHLTSLTERKRERYTKRTREHTHRPKVLDEEPNIFLINLLKKKKKNASGSPTTI